MTLTTPTRLAAAGLVAGVMLLAACGDDDAVDVSSVTSTEPAPTTSEGSAAPTEDATGATTVPDAAAAVVDDVEISEAQLAAEQEAAAAFAAANPEAAAGFAPGEDGSFDPAATRFLLTELIQAEVLGAAVEEGDVVVTDADRSEAQERVAGVESTPWLEDFVERQALLNALSRREAEAAGIPATAEAWYEEHQDEMVCARHLLVPTEEEAEAARARIVDGGEDFANVAGEVSTDTGSGAEGGDLGCAPAALYVPEFAAATLDQPVGEVGQPVETQFGWHVILVERRGEDIELAEVEEAVRFALQNETAAIVSGARAELLGAADIAVADTYGRWDPTQLLIVGDDAGLEPPALDEVPTTEPG